MSQIIIGYTAEGTTDTRFLSSIIQRTFVEIGAECRREIEVVEPIIHINKEKNNSFVEQILNCSQLAFEKGIMAFCVHVDADDNTDRNVFETRINPAIVEINKIRDGLCSNIVPIIPVQMTESWMLADKELLKEEIGTNLSYFQLGLDKAPETVTNPKELITDAIRVARSGTTKKRRRNLSISELYQPIGQKISLQMLDEIPSYVKFKEAVRGAYRNLNYLQ